MEMHADKCKEPEVCHRTYLGKNLRGLGVRSGWIEELDFSACIFICLEQGISEHIV